MISVIDLFDALRQSRGDEDLFKSLRQVEHLAVVEIDLIEVHSDASETQTLLDALKENRRAWKWGLVDVLKSSPSKERKFLRWRVTSSRTYPKSHVLETGELEVYPGTSL